LDLDLRLDLRQDLLRSGEVASQSVCPGDLSLQDQGILPSCGSQRISEALLAQFRFAEIPEFG
jgi:hypothetical protein